MCGISVKDDIAHNEAMLCIPYKAILSSSKARAQPQLAKVFRANPELFDQAEQASWEHYMLMAFVVFELQKGEDSFWHPYFEILPADAKCFWRWDPKVIKLTQDPAIIVQRPRKTTIYNDSIA